MNKEEAYNDLEIFLINNDNFDCDDMQKILNFIEELGLKKK